MSEMINISNNGINIDALLGAREALIATPEAARFNWRANCTWFYGTHSSTSIEKFYGLGSEQAHRKVFTFDADHPQIFDSEDYGITPPEYILVGLAGCLTAGIASVAQNRGIHLNSVTASVEADMDLQGVLGMDSDVRSGFGNINVHFKIDADASEEEIAAIVAQSQKRSAVFDNVTNPTNVTVRVNPV